MGRLTKVIVGGLICAALGACAERPDRIEPNFKSAASYANYSCAGLAEELEIVNAEIDRLTPIAEADARRDRIAAASGVVGALIFLRGNGDAAFALADLKGKKRALIVARQAKNCT